jgi:hypothetical protein
VRIYRYIDVISASLFVPVLLQGYEYLTNGFFLVVKHYALKLKISYKKKQRRPPSKKKKRGKKPKPEEQEGMPQRRHCRPEKRHGDKNPECHEEQLKDVA